MSKKSLSQWLEFIESVHFSTIDMGLSRINLVYQALNIDLSNCCVITVAGTNGKGTTCRFIEAACNRIGLHVGVYASPHIERFNERIRINEAEVSDDKLCEAFTHIHNVASRADNGEPVSLTYFEYATLAALYVFAESSLDVCVLEVGLGGRLDATNIVDANIGVITSIGLDHQAFLGDDEASIAGEKAGIIKAGQDLVVGYKPVHDVIIERAEHLMVESALCGIDFGCEVDSHTQQTLGWLSVDGFLAERGKWEFDLSDAKLPAQNIMTAITTLLIMADYCQQHLLASRSEQFTNALNQLSEQSTYNHLIANTTMSGRFEQVGTSPNVYVDVAHNVQACELLVERIRTLSYKRCHIIVGMLKDKNIEDCLQVLSELQPQWYCVDLPSERGEKADRFIQYLDAQQQVYEPLPAPSVSDAYQVARRNATSDDIIVLVGSFVLAAEFKALKNVE